MRRVVRDLQYFKERTETDPVTGCWLWKLGLTPNGYGVAGRSTANRRVKAHRAAWEAANGPIPSGLCVCHRCDVRHCCNPDHLFLGTRADNARDKVEKGRHPRGSSANGAKLKEADVATIKKLMGLGVGVCRLARLFGVAPTSISHIKDDSTWRHVLEAP